MMSKLLRRLCSLITCVEETKTYCPVNGAITPQQQQQQQQQSNLHVVSKFGLDGSGCHKKRHQSATPALNKDVTTSEHFGALLK